MLSKWKVYIKPFTDDGIYQEDWIDVTADVDFQKMGSIATDLDNTEFDIGIYRTSRVSLTLNNRKGLYSDVDNFASIFKYTRADSLCKITWSMGDLPVCGLFNADGSYALTEETEVFIGMLNDESLELSIEDDKVTFLALGRESIFMRTIVPFDTVNSGDLVSETIYLLLNQESITDLLTVDQANITCGMDQAIDSIASLQHKTVQEGLNKLLLASNSVLYIQNGTIIVAPRTPTPAVQYEFYGQASALGPENALKIARVKNGLQRVINYLVWESTTVNSTDEASVLKYGAKKKSVSFEFITDDTKRQNTLDSIRDEFSLPKQEFHLTAPLNHDTIVLGLLDRVTLDYPTVYLADDQELPVCGVAICGEAILPTAQWSFRVESTDSYKIIGRQIDVAGGTVTFRLRAI